MNTCESLVSTEYIFAKVVFVFSQPHFYLPIAVDISSNHNNFIALPTESAEDIRNDWIGDQEISISDPRIVNNESKPKLEVVPLPNEVSKSSNKNMTKRLASLTRSPIFQLDLAPDREEGSMNVENEGDPEKSARGSEISVSAGQDSFNDRLDYLLDAARCIRAETQLQEAETVVDALIAKFAEPLDLYTAWENLHRSSPIPMTYSQKGLSSSMMKETKSPTFSPILSLLMAQSEANIFPQLCQPSSTGKKLLELCSQLAGDIRRLKRKVSFRPKVHLNSVHLVVINLTLHYSHNHSLKTKLIQPRPTIKPR